METQPTRTQECPWLFTQQYGKGNHRKSGYYYSSQKSGLRNSSIFRFVLFWKCQLVFMISVPISFICCSFGFLSYLRSVTCAWTVWHDDSFRCFTRTILDWCCNYDTCFFWLCRALKVNTMENLENILSTLLYTSTKGTQLLHSNITHSFY